MKSLKTLALSALTLFAIGTLGACQNKPSLQDLADNKSISKTTTSNEASPADVPSDIDSQSALTPGVIDQLGTTNIVYDNGSYIVNNNKTDLNAKVNSKAYATNQKDAKGRPWRGEALLDKSTRQYRNRKETGQGRTSWTPQGWHQMTKLKGHWTHAVDRGHILGYAQVGGIKGFDASESNPDNVATQTAWANEARSANSKGQNYYENIVRKAQDQHKRIRYRVTDIYEGDDLVPHGAHMEAKSSDGSVEFNVFIPNVQPNITIDYATGVVTPH